MAVVKMKFKENVTESIDNLNALESRVTQLETFESTNIDSLVAKINYLYRLAGGE